MLLLALGIVGVGPGIMYAVLAGHPPAGVSVRRDSEMLSGVLCRSRPTTVPSLFADGRPMLSDVLAGWKGLETNQISGIRGAKPRWLGHSRGVNSTAAGRGRRRWRQPDARSMRESYPTR